MEEKLKNVFKQAKYDARVELKEKIWINLMIRNKRITYFKLISFSSVNIISLIGFIPMFKVLANDFAQSGFYEYLSLAFSSNSLFSSSWKDFAYSLAESLPTMNIVFSLTIIFIFFLSLRYAIKQFIINNNYIGPSYEVA
jgi:hypothetical protein